MNTPRLAINAGYIEVEKPSGGGKGRDALYHLTVVIDGKPALFLTSHEFKQPGQMEAFLEIIERLIVLERKAAA